MHIHRVIEGVELSGGVFRGTAFMMEFNSKNGGLSSLTDIKSGKTVNLKLEYLYYESSVGDQKYPQASGAYIFR